jgi:hypothetical protein
MRFHTHECFTEVDEDRGVEDIVGVQMDVLDVVEIE